MTEPSKEHEEISPLQRDYERERAMALQHRF